MHVSYPWNLLFLKGKRDNNNGQMVNFTMKITTFHIHGSDYGTLEMNHSI